MNETPKKDRTWLYVGVAFAAFWAAYLIFFNPRNAVHLEGTGLTLPADYGWKLEDLEGKPVTLGDYRGRVILLNVFATWCGPCLGEMPSLVSLAKNPKLKGVAFLCVTNETSDRSIEKYAHSNMQGLTVLRSEALPAVFTTEGIPATFIIAPDGAVVASVVGAANWNDPAVVDFVEKQLK